MAREHSVTVWEINKCVLQLYSHVLLFEKYYFQAEVKGPAF